MSQTPVFKKGALALMMGLLASVSATEIRNLQAYSDPFCNTFNSDGSDCVKCSFRYYKKAGKCTQVSDLCKTWSNINGACLSCYLGYGSPKNGKCYISNGGGQQPEQPDVGSGDIDENCQCHRDDRTCKTCFAGYQLINGVCEQIDVGQPDDPCIQYEYVDKKGFWYKKWFTGCQKICVECAEGYYLNQLSQCTQLPEGCIDAEPTGICNECDEGYTLTDGVCEIDVGQPVDPCAQYGYLHLGKWYKKWFNGCKKVCKQCIEGYYLDKENQCQQLPEGCLAADKNGDCTQCDEGYTLTDGVCQVDVGQPEDPCAQYGYIDNNGKWFKKWFSGCKKVCIQCIDGYTLNQETHQCQPDVGEPPVDDYCIRKDTYGKCEICAYRTINKYGVCKKVSDDCQTWNETTGKCTSCYGGYHLDNGVCKL